jgi:plastocyanin
MNHHLSQLIRTRVEMRASLTVKFCQACFAIYLITVFSLSSTAANIQYEVIEGEIENSGSIVGVVTFSGTATATKMFKVDTDESECGSEMPSEELQLGSNNGIHNVVLSIEDIETGKNWNLPTEFVYDQKNCRFNPHVMIIRPRTKGVVLNSDNLVHNVHTISKGIFSFNKATKAHGETHIKERKIRKPGIIRVKCDMHYWMKGWWIVAKNPYTTLTNQDGKFSIGNIPAGHYTVRVWHEKLGESDYSIEVKAGEALQMNVTLDQETG